MAHMTPEEFIQDMLRKKIVTEESTTREIMELYHDYTLEQAAEDAQLRFDDVDMVDKNSILKNKFNK